MEFLFHPPLLERLTVEPVTRLFMSYEAVQPLDKSRVQPLKRLFGLPGVLPVVIGALPLDELRDALPLDGILYAGQHGAVFHEPEEVPDRLERHLRIPDSNPSLLRRALTGWVLANRSPSDCFVIYIGCGESDRAAMQLVQDLNGWAVFASGDCFPLASEPVWQNAPLPATS
ncbi:MAG: hypothetical protein ACOYXO_15695 [Chloroflexota bacterium]